MRLEHGKGGDFEGPRCRKSYCTDTINVKWLTASIDDETECCGRKREGGKSFCPSSTTEKKLKGSYRYHHLFFFFFYSYSRICELCGSFFFRDERADAGVAVGVDESKIVDLEFLNPEELKIIQEDAYRDHMVGVDANLVSSDGWVFDVNVRRWNMDKKSGSSSHIYNLVTGWKTVVSFCGLKENDTIRVWSFRSGDDELYFALVPPTSDSGESKSEEMCSSSVTCEKSHDDLPPN
ncbi:putative B3 domain-containing protein At1g05615 [Eutrema salsugineum]|uniref:putative B3 domain-containing protein At1g05615 n=1 Tax=Eutrema salsugineum TaxID=72664 RepID=UPI000CED2631|nr:putative B3 domain-containing protein At1g05615 [Eutrema salsugineum]